MKKNIAPIERTLRAVSGLLLACCALVFLGPPYSYCAAALGAVLTLTGLLGYCPMCHVAGRKPTE